MKKLFSLLTLLLFAGATIAQNVGINTPSPTSSLDINGGLRLRPAVTTVSAFSVNLANNRTHHVLAGTPTGDFTISIAGSIVEGQHLIITNGTLFKGFLAPINILPNTTVELIYSSAAWKLIGSNEPLSATVWSRTGNGGTIDGVNNLFGTTDNKPIRFIIDNYPSGLMDAVKYNYFIGDGAGFSNGLGIDNAGFGSRTLRNNISGDYNTAVGSLALSGNKGGSSATAVGYNALGSDTAADGTVAIGASALYYNMARQGNTAVGTTALYNNCNPVFGPINSNQGLANTAIGYTALYNNVSGSGSIAIGYRAAFGNISGDAIIAIGNSTLFNNNDRKGNIAIGDFALYNNGVGATGFFEANNNVAVGNRALLSNTKGYSNTGLGFEVLRNNTIGSGNTAVGNNSLYNNLTGLNNTAIGSSSLLNNTQGFSNVAIGIDALRLNTTKSNLVAIGDSALYNNGVGATNPFQSLRNTAVGSKTLYNNTLGTGNVALGYQALYSNREGDNNIAIGDLALHFNGQGASIGQGENNVAVGTLALYINTTGNSNTGIGHEVLRSNSGGGGNTAVGAYSLRYSNGNDNTAFGTRAMENRFGGTGNVAIGVEALRNNGNGVGNIAVGVEALRSNQDGSSNIAIGNNAGAAELTSNKLYIENSDANKDNALIYGDFAADSLLLNAKTVVRNNAVVRGFTKLGGYASDVPSIKMKKFTGTSSPSQNGFTDITHGLSRAKIIGVQVIMKLPGFVDLGPGSRVNSGYEYEFQILDSIIRIANFNGNSANILSKNFVVLVTYEE